MDKAANEKSAGKKEHKITAMDAANLWNHLTARYDMTENKMIMLDYAKDKKLHKQLKDIFKHVNRQARKLEKEMAEHAVVLPPRPPADIKFTEQIPLSMTDLFICKRVFDSIQWFLPAHMTAFQQSTSPTLREMFKNFFLQELDIFERFQDFGIAKNWLQTPPEYRSAHTEGRDKPTIMEVAQLWGRLNARYDTIEFTNYMANHAKDPDFKAAIAVGQAMLNKHASELEETMLEYGLPLPARPPAAEKTAKPVDAVSDQYIFRHILKGIQSYLPVHVVAFQNSSTPSLRKKFKSVLTEELDVYDRFFTYGQLKGWTHNFFPGLKPVPQKR